MSQPRLLHLLAGLILIACLPIDLVHAQNIESFVSGAGLDGNPCTRAAPCASFGTALSHTLNGGQINVLDSGNYGSLIIDRSISIVNDTAGTASITDAGGPVVAQAQIQINASSNAIVTLRGLVLNGAFLTSSGVQINNAHLVNIENCLIQNSVDPAILVAPNLFGQPGPLASDINVTIVNTVVTGSSTGARITSVPGVVVNASISRSSFLNGTGGGIRIDGLGGGTITANISDTVSSLNPSNGLVAISGAGNVTVHVARSVLAENGLSGVQSNATNGGTSRVTVNGSTITNNAGGNLNFFGGGAGLLTFGDNRVDGTLGTGFNGAISQF